MHILVVEDNTINQKVICRLLEKEGCDVSLAKNGKEAVELVKKNKYDLILMDIQMPVMDGFEATIHIRKAEKRDERIPIVAITANAIQGDLERCIEFGMDDYIVKPIDRKKLIKILGHANHKNKKVLN